MNYGLYLSASGALNSLYRQDVLSNNLANLNTVGFKPDLPVTRQRLPERLEDSGADADPQWLLERMGGGLLGDPTRVLLTQGDLVQSDNPLDVAVDGDGFFVVSNGKGGANGDDGLRLTRDGRFTRNAAGELVMATTGMPVMDTTNRPIRLDSDAPITIDADGTLRQGGAIQAQIRLANVADSTELTKEGANLFRPTSPASLAPAPGSSRVLQGYTEASDVDPILTLNALMNTTRVAQANTLLMQYHDNLMDQAINTFGRVA